MFSYIVTERISRLRSDTPERRAAGVLGPVRPIDILTILPVLAVLALFLLGCPAEEPASDAHPQDGAGGDSRDRDQGIADLEPSDALPDDLADMDQEVDGAADGTDVTDTGQDGDEAGDVQGDGDTGPGGNQRASEAYQTGDVFVLSNRLPSDVAMAVPVAVHRQGAEVLAIRPLLVVHEEDGGWDADAVLDFLSRYQATRVVTTGLPSALVSHLGTRDLTVSTISADDLLAYWSHLESVVYADDSPLARAFGASLAAELDAPLIVRDSAADTVGAFEGRTTYLVDTSCPSSAADCELLPPAGPEMWPFHLDLLPDSCRHLLLFHSGDQATPGAVPAGGYTTEQGGTIEALFSHDSLLAPYLAAARGELLVPVTSSRLSNIQEVLGSALRTCEALGQPSTHLTILASPFVIPLQSWNGSIQEAVDTRILANRDADPFLELAVGRLMGYTVSDTSALVNRSLFYETINGSPVAILAWPRERYYNRIEAEFIDEALSAQGFTVERRYEPWSLDPEELTEASLFFFFGHGDTRSFSSILSSDDLEGMSLAPLLVGPVGCNSCDFAREPWLPALICLQFIRHGAVGFIGATDGVATGYNDMALLVAHLLQGDDLGAAYRVALDRGLMNLVAWANFLDIEVPLDTFYSQFLLGDPLFDFGLASPPLDPVEPIIRALEGDRIQIEWNLPAEESIDGVRVEGDRIFTGPFGLEVQRARGFAPPVVDGIPSYFEDRIVAVIPFTLPAGMVLDSVESVEVRYRESDFITLSTMPLETCPLMSDNPVQRWVVVMEDQGESVTRRYYLALLENAGGSPPTVMAATRIEERTYRLTLSYGSDRIRVR